MKKFRFIYVVVLAIAIACLFAGCNDDTTIVNNNGIPLPPDLLVSDITFASPNNFVGENGTLTVTITNRGGDLSSCQGLLNWYNNFTYQGFVFAGPGGICDFVPNQPLPDTANPLRSGESISFTWQGTFTASKFVSLYFYVDSSDELFELNEDNNGDSFWLELKRPTDDLLRAWIHAYNSTWNAKGSTNAFLGSYAFGLGPMASDAITITAMEFQISEASALLNIKLSSGDAVYGRVIATPDPTNQICRFDGFSFPVVTGLPAVLELHADSNSAVPDYLDGTVTITKIEFITADGTNHAYEAAAGSETEIYFYIQ